MSQQDRNYNARRYWLLFVCRLDTMLQNNSAVHEKVEKAIRRHYTYEPKPLLPRLRWRQKQKRSLPFFAKEQPGHWGYLVDDSSMHYALRRTENVIFFRKPGKRITRKYIEHLCKELGYYLA